MAAHVFGKIMSLLSYSKNVARKSLCNPVSYKSIIRTYNQNASQRLKNKSTLYYVSAAGVLTVALSYAAVPLYRIFCQAYGYGGTTAEGHDASKVETMRTVKYKPIKIKFNADVSSSMRWNFKPQHSEITVSNFLIVCKFECSAVQPIFQVELHSSKVGGSTTLNHSSIAITAICSLPHCNIFHVVEE